jgi:hypothetical protein
MPASRRHLLALASNSMFSTLVGCGGGGQGSASDATPASAGRVLTLQVESKRVGFTYPISVFLPSSYEAETVPYPTIYANDGDAPFVANTTRFATLQNVLIARQSKAILIGIGAYERRQIDYNFPGAVAYHDFIAQELIPEIETRFRCDPQRRMLTGLSTGGSFAATALFIEAPAQRHFKVFLSVEAAFWQQLDLDNSLEQQMASAVGASSLPVALILARCATGTAGSNYNVVIDMYNRVASRQYADFTLLQSVFATDHVGADVPAFDDVMSRMLL